MANKKEMVTITGKSREEVAYNLLTYAVKESIRPFNRQEPLKTMKNSWENIRKH